MLQRAGRRLLQAAGVARQFSAVPEKGGQPRSAISQYAAPPRGPPLVPLLIANARAAPPLQPSAIPHSASSCPSATRRACPCWCACGSGSGARSPACPLPSSVKQGSQVIDSIEGAVSAVVRGTDGSSALVVHDCLPPVARASTSFAQTAHSRPPSSAALCLCCRAGDKLPSHVAVVRDAFGAHDDSHRALSQEVAALGPHKVSRVAAASPCACMPL